MHSMAMRITPMMQKCPVCGLPFARTCSAEAWGYAYDGKLVCSYHCMKEAERKDNMSEVKLTDEQRKIRNAEILRLHQEKMPAKEIAERFSMTVNGVWFVLRNMKKAQAEEPEEIPEAAETEEPAPEEPEPPAAPAVDDGKEKLLRKEIVDLQKLIADLKAQRDDLKKALDAQKKLTEAATQLMYAWKEKHEVTMRAQKVAEQLAVKERAYFDALRDTITDGEVATCHE